VVTTFLIFLSLLLKCKPADLINYIYFNSYEQTANFMCKFIASKVSGSPIRTGLEAAIHMY
jgi:hypothetical protein